jgi:predicted dehydrogenase
MVSSSVGKPLLSMDIPPKRLTQKDMGGGSLLNYGCYNVMLANLIFNEKPKEIIARGHVWKEGEYNILSLHTTHNTHTCACTAACTHTHI